MILFWCKNMGTLNYNELGFLCGLEIHQRLMTKEKLFCSCDTSFNLQKDPYAKIRRSQRAVAGESGSIDMSAKFEESKSRNFIYHIYNNNTCLVDIDEEPPHSLNSEALDIVLSISNAFHTSNIYEIQPMRKEVVDGSNPTAFQRTMLIGIDGYIELNGNTNKIPSVSLEEESSGIMSNNSLISIPEIVNYNTERVGIPLIEINTDEHIKNPQQAKDIALYIGTILRITGNVQRGIGSIRQDVNVSIRDGSRVEIKGLQELNSLDKFIENEVLRQINLIKIKNMLKQRNVSISDSIDLSEILRNSKSKIIKGGLKEGGVVYGFKLKGFAGLLSMEVNPERRLGTEISDYAKMSGVKGLIHSDEDLNKYEFLESEIKSVRDALKINKDDAFILITGKMLQVKKAIQFSINRSNYAMTGVPLETRGIFNTKLYTTKFLRPLPGGSRMYPETDIKPIMITPRMVKDSEKQTPNIKEMRFSLKSELGNETLVNQMIMSHRLSLYLTISKNTNAPKPLIANILLQKFTELSRQNFDVDNIPETELIKLFDIYSKGMITKQGIDEILKQVSEGKGVLQAIKQKGLHKILTKELIRIIEQIKKNKPSISNINILKEIMQKYRLNVDGEELNNLLKKQNGKEYETD